MAEESRGPLKFPALLTLIAQLLPGIETQLRRQIQLYFIDADFTAAMLLLCKPKRLARRLPARAS